MISVAPTLHSASSTSVGLAVLGPFSHSGPSMPIAFRIVFTGPVAGLKRYTKPSVAATIGASAGR